MVRKPTQSRRGRLPGGSLSALSLRGCRRTSEQMRRRGKPRKWKERPEQKLGVAGKEKSEITAPPLLSGWQVVAAASFPAQSSA